MRVITGTARGRKLKTLEGMSVRPTTEMVKESMFSILQFELEQSMVLDLFAGSGQLGIEALSRGARYCVFVDQSRESLEIIRDNLKTTGLFEHSRVASMDALAYLRSCKERFDIAILDPPYESGLIEQALPLLADKMNENGIIVCETSKSEMLPKEVGLFAIHREYKYGKVKLTTYRVPRED